VYGLWIDAGGYLLLTEERHANYKRILKFPGGGLEFGEGPADCLRREFAEETGLPVERYRHFYTTDFYQPSYFRANEQVLSIYYLVRCPADALPHAEDPRIQEFYKVRVPALRPERLTLPIDQVVGRLLVEAYAARPDALWV
jgi:ADP-ribose pyrophosphatase YjhB (NUDIX family)